MHKFRCLAAWLTAAMIALSFGITAPGAKGVALAQDLGYEDVEHIAGEHELFMPKEPNPNLIMTPGDIHWWVRQKLTAAEYRRQFAARQRALTNAGKYNRKFNSMADLSAYVEGVDPSLRFNVK